MPARVAIRSMFSSVNDAPSANSASVAASTRASISARLALTGSGRRDRVAMRQPYARLDTVSNIVFNRRPPGRDTSGGPHMATTLLDHAQHFNRFYEQVVGYDGTFDKRLERAREDLNEAFLVLFDEHLVDACDRLMADRGDLEAKVDFVRTYHMVIEGTLALTGQFYITDYCEQHDVLPGFTEGFRNISRDEHRHVAYGTWYLKERCQDPAIKARVQDKLVELLPVAAGVFVPPGLQLGDSYEILGYSSDHVNEFAFTALSRRLKVIGVELPAVTTA